jgi:hypothetical protein
LACGYNLRVANVCNSEYAWVYVADHGPNTDNYCGIPCPCGSDIGCDDRIIDLTPTAFMQFASLSDGLVNVWVTDLD